MSRAVAILLAGSLLLIFFGIINALQRSQGLLACRNFTEGTLTVHGHQLSVAIADTPSEQARGLSGCEKIPENAGMVFPYAVSQPAVFWMKDMVIPIDIVWIRDGQVVGIDANLQPPMPDTPDRELTRYRSPGPVTAVLELPANQAAALDIQPGTRVE